MIRSFPAASLVILVLFMTASLPGTPAGSRVPDQTAPLVIRFTGLRNTRGQMTIGINSVEKGWPRQPEYEFRWDKSDASNGELVVSVPGLKPGTYAVSALDDENRNLEMDMTLGIPREGWGFSQNPPFRLAVPRFGECAIHLPPGGSEITIEIRYSGGRRSD